MPSSSRLRACATVVSLVLAGGGLSLAPASASTTKASPFRGSHVKRSAQRATYSTLVVRGTAAELSVARRIALSHGATVRHDLGKLGALSLHVPTADLARVRSSLASVPSAKVELAGTRAYQDVPNDPDYSHQSLYYNDVDAPAAWDVTHGSSAVKIAVIDSGIDLTHPDLAGKVVAQYNAHDGSTDVTDTTGHGTFVAGVAAAASNNAVGVVGSGFDSSLIVVKVEDEVGDISTDDEAAGIIWATDHSANVISISLGSSEEDPLEDSAVKYAEGKGVVVVAAAGNESLASADWPAAIPGVIGVAALGTNDDVRADFSNHGAHVSVAAPGVGIYSTIPLAGSDDFDPGSYDTGDGTSFSTPMVSGEVALLKAYAPAATADQLRNAVISSALPLPGQDVGAGKVRFDVALTHLPPISTPTITAPLVTDTATGVEPISADSTAPQVQYAVDGVDIGGRVDVVSGHAPSTWSTYGYANASHALQAKDCNTYGCGPAASVSIPVTNTAPAVTAPTAAQKVTGVTILNATTPGGSVAYFVDGKKVGVSTTAPFRVSFNTSTVPNGTHLVHAVTCTAAGRLCAGTASPDVSFTSNSLHPTVSAGPLAFSPNGDGRHDVAVAQVTLPDVEHIDWYVVNADTGATVNGPHTLGYHPKGTYSFTWNGKSNAGAALPDGYYTLRAVTASGTGAGVVRGLAGANIRMDDTKPTLSALMGANQVVYPFKDGYRDTIVLGAHSNEDGLGFVNVFTTKHVLLGNFGAGTKDNTVVLNWGGTRNSPPAALAPGTYLFQVGILDAAGNAGVTSQYPVGVSPKKLVKHTTAVNLQGKAIADQLVTDPPCTSVSPKASSYVGVGLQLRNSCDPSTEDFQEAIAEYTFQLPVAARYDTLELDALGYSASGSAQSPTFVVGEILDVAKVQGDEDHPSFVGDTEGWVKLAGGSATDHVNGRIVDSAIILPTDDDGYADFDVKQVRMVVGYDVLA